MAIIQIWAGISLSLARACSPETLHHISVPASLVASVHPPPRAQDHFYCYKHQFLALVLAASAHPVGGMAKLSGSQIPLLVSQDAGSIKLPPLMGARLTLGGAQEGEATCPASQEVGIFYSKCMGSYFPSKQQQWRP